MSRGRAWILPVLLLAALVVGAGWLLLGQGAPALSPAAQSATSEALQFATSQVLRQSTREAAAASSTALAVATANEASNERASAEAETATSLARAATATAQAPPTETARAIAYETARSEADATADTLEQQATVAYGPTGGTLEQTRPDQVACDSAHLRLHNFIAEARFHNPDPTLGAWDYGIVFPPMGEDMQYRLILDSYGRWALTLHAVGFDMENRDVSTLIDLSPGGSNALKLYVTDDTSLLYVNGRFVDSLDLALFGQGQSSGAVHNVMACAGIREEDGAADRKTSYDGFTVWSLP